MTVQEVIQAIRLDGLTIDGSVKRIKQFVNGLAEATELLEEVEQYRALGTVEELKEAREKQVAKKPIGRHTDYKCSVCGRRVRSGKGSSSRQRDNFCQRCGTKIDWEEGAE